MQSTNCSAAIVRVMDDLGRKIEQLTKHALWVHDPYKKHLEKLRKERIKLSGGKLSYGGGVEEVEVDRYGELFKKRLF